mmetsp:Transcript_50142/g.133189  ORF Transcript_50142/g.133189 Transcript_50142/m.133189 type:complete len:264 (+) Transcript_50142:373-1164(+)
MHYERDAKSHHPFVCPERGHAWLSGRGEELHCSVLCSEDKAVFGTKAMRAERPRFIGEATHDVPLCIDAHDDIGMIASATLVLKEVVKRMTVKCRGVRQVPLTVATTSGQMRANLPLQLGCHHATAVDARRPRGEHTAVISQTDVHSALLHAHHPTHHRHCCDDPAWLEKESKSQQGQIYAVQFQQHREDAREGPMQQRQDHHDSIKDAPWIPQELVPPGQPESRKSLRTHDKANGNLKHRLPNRPLVPVIVFLRASDGSPES